MKISLPDGTVVWQNADGSIVPYTGQDGADPRDTTNTKRAGDITGTPKVGDVTETPYGSIIFTGTDVNGNPITHFIPKASYADKVISIGGKLVDASNGNVVYDGTGGSGGGGVSATTAYTQQQANARDAAALAEQQRQYNETFGYNKARGDQQQQVSEGQLSGVFRGQPTENARQFNTSTALDYFKNLSSVASNPRNFMQNFFQSRGQVAPAGSDQYGNVQALQRFLPNFVGAGVPQWGGTTTAAAPAAAPVQRPAAADPMNTGGIPLGGQYAGNTVNQIGSSGYYGVPGAQGAPTPSGSGMTIPGVPGATQGITPADVYKQYPGMSQGDAANAFANSLVNSGSRSTAYANGGIVPEPVIGVGVHSGKKYMFGENGPEGVVPADMLPHFLQQRHGQEMGGGNGPTRSYAYGGEIGYDQYADPYTPPTLGGGYYPPAVTDPYYPGNTTSTTYTDPFASTGGGGYYPNAQPDPTATSPLPQPAPAPVTPTPSPIQTTVPPVPTTVSAPTVSAPAVTTPVTAPSVIAPRGSVNPIVTPPPLPISQPQELPQASNNFNAQGPSTGGVTPGSVAPPGTFNPKASPYAPYLPQFLPGEDTPLTSLLGQGVLPPFLGRTFAQQHGAQQFGTNQPNPFVLPSGVPLISKLAYSQMIPSERSAFESYISSFGITPEDYLNYVEQVSPQGAQTQIQNFGNRFQSYKQ